MGVVVPFGVCAEPSNVKAGGHACPYRFRCVGCDHFRTDVSYLPDLTAHLDDLLRNRERLLAATDVDTWAKTEAMPSDAEISRIRRLIGRIKDDLADLTADERAQIERAVTVVRAHRKTALGMPRVRQPLPDVRPERSQGGLRHLLQHLPDGNAEQNGGAERSGAGHDCKRGVNARES